jgi:hypothetical protein
VHLVYANYCPRHPFPGQPEHFFHTLILYTRRYFPIISLSPTLNLYIGILRIIPRNIIMRTSHLRQIIIHRNILHRKEMLPRQGNLAINIRRIIRVIIMHREPIFVRNIHLLSSLHQPSFTVQTLRQKWEVGKLVKLTEQSGTFLPNKLQNCVPAIVGLAFFCHASTTA